MMKRGRILLAAACLLGGSGNACSVLAGEQAPVLRLSLDECVSRALRENLQLAVHALDSDIARVDFLAAAARDPVLVAGLSFDSDHKPTSSALEGGEGRAEVSEETLVWDAGISKPLPAGGSLGIRWGNNRFDTDSEYQTINPVHRTSVWLEWKQPLLQRFGAAVNKAGEHIALRNRERYEYLYHQYQWDVAERVSGLYWYLIHASVTRDARRLAFRQATKLLDMTEADMEEGRSSRTDVLRTKAEVADREGRIIAAEEALSDLEDRLKFSMNLGNDAQASRSVIIPTTVMAYHEVTIDEAETVSNALAGSLEYKALEAELKAAELRTLLARNELLPAVDLTGRIGLRGVGESYGDDIDQITGGDYEAWSVGMTFALPLGRHAEKGRLDRRLIQERQLALRMSAIEQDIRVGVRRLVRRLRSSAGRVKAAEKVREYRGRNLDAEEERFKLGMATNEDVLEAQQDNAEAEGEYVQHLVTYNQAWLSLQRAIGAALPASNAAGPLRDTDSREP